MTRGARLKIAVAVAVGAALLGVGSSWAYGQLDGRLPRAWQDSWVLAVDTDGTLLVSFYEEPPNDNGDYDGEVPGAALISTSGKVTEVLAPQDDPADCQVEASGALDGNRIAVAFTSFGGRDHECRTYGLWTGTSSGLSKAGEVTRGADALDVQWGSLWFIDGGLTAVGRMPGVSAGDDTYLGRLDPTTGVLTTWRTGIYLGLFPDACGTYGIDFSVGVIDAEYDLQPMSMTVDGGQLTQTSMHPTPAGYASHVPVISCGTDVAFTSSHPTRMIVWQNEGQIEAVPLGGIAGDVYLGPDIAATRVFDDLDEDPTLLIWDRHTREQLVSMTSCARQLFVGEWIVVGTRQHGRCVPSATTLDALAPGRAT